MMYIASKRSHIFSRFSNEARIRIRINIMSVTLRIHHVLMTASPSGFSPQTTPQAVFRLKRRRHSADEAVKPRRKHNLPASRQGFRRPWKVFLEVQGRHGEYPVSTLRWGPQSKCQLIYDILQTMDTDLLNNPDAEDETLALTGLWGLDGEFHPRPRLPIDPELTMSSCGIIDGDTVRYSFKDDPVYDESSEESLPDLVPLESPESTDTVEDAD